MKLSVHHNFIPLPQNHLSLLIMLTTALAFSGCAEDEVATEYSIYVTVTPDILSHEGSDSSLISVRVLDQNNVPASAGMAIVIQGRNLNNAAATTGALGAEGNEFEPLYLDSAGSTMTSFQCTEEVDVLLIAQLETGEMGTALLYCDVLYNGDWSIESLSAQRALLPPSDTTELYATAVTNNGSPVPGGTEITFEVLSGEGGLGGSFSDSIVSSTDSSGVAVASFDSGDVNGETVVSAYFTNEGLGDNSQSITLITDENAPVEPTVLISASATSLLADGNATSELTVSVFQGGGEALVGKDVLVTTDRGSLRDSSGGSWEEGLTLTTNESGQAQFSFRTSSEPGRANIVGTVNGNDFNPSVDGDVEGTITILMLQVGSVEFLEAGEVPLGVQGSGRNETTEICFQVLDNEGDPFPSGYEVNFVVSSSSSGGDVLSLAEYTDEDGIVCTIASAGNTFGVITVEPCVQVGSTEICGEPVEISVVGATATRAGMTISCNDVNLGALRYRVGSTIESPASGEICTECSLILSDRNGNPVGFEQTIIFAAEVGNFVPSAQVVNDENGVATVKWCAQGNMPADVDPLADEPYWVDDDGTILNSRDGLVTLIAYMSGEEEFTDSNEDGTWSEGEIFWDLPEPFIDSNDNNDYDPSGDLQGERHIDIEQAGHTDGEHDGPNGEWDSDGFIWTQTHIVLTGSPAFATYDDGSSIELDLDEETSGSQEHVLSHWFVAGFPGISIGNLHAAVADPSCFDFPSPDYCLSLYNLGAEDEDGAMFEVYWVARDMFGNPMNGSLETFSLYFETQLCGQEDESFSTTPMSFTPSSDVVPGPNEYPFDYSIDRLSADDASDSDLLMPYEVSISNFVSGSYQRFIFYRFNATEFPLPPSDCRVYTSTPINACPTCEDPYDTTPDPFFIITQ